MHPSRNFGYTYPPLVEVRYPLCFRSHGGGWQYKATKEMAEGLFPRMERSFYLVLRLSSRINHPLWGPQGYGDGRREVSKICEQCSINKREVSAFTNYTVQHACADLSIHKPLTCSDELGKNKGFHTEFLGNVMDHCDSLLRGEEGSVTLYTRFNHNRIPGFRRQIRGIFDRCRKARQIRYGNLWKLQPVARAYTKPVSHARTTCRHHIPEFIPISLSYPPSGDDSCGVF